MWDKLSMADRAKYIQLGVANGVTSLDEIKDTYNKYAEGGPKRVHNNTSPTAELSTKLEDVVATKIRNDKRINHAYDIPYLEDKETKIIGYTVPTNALDSIAKYAGKTKHDLDEAVALAFESGYGRQPYFNYGTKNISDRAIGNMNYFKNYGSIPSHLFVRDYEYTKGGYNKNKPYTDQAPLEHAINFFRSGRYNTKLRAVDPETGKTINHTQKVKLEAKKLRKDPNYQKWKKQSGLDEYTGKAQQARDRQKAIDAENARKAKYRKEHPIKAYFKDALGIKYDDGGLLIKEGDVSYIDPALVSYVNNPSSEDTLIGEDFFTKKYRRPDGSTYTHVPLNDWTPTTTKYTAKDSRGNTLRSATGKLVTGNTQQEANNKLFWDNYNNVPLLTPKDPVAAAKEAASYIPFIGEGLDLYDIGKDVYSGNYGQAALGAGLFLLPEFLEKPVKKGYKWLKDVNYWRKKYKDKDIITNSYHRKNFISALKNPSLRREANERLWDAEHTENIEDVKYKLNKLNDLESKYNVSISQDDIFGIRSKSEYDELDKILEDVVTKSKWYKKQLSEIENVSPILKDIAVESPQYHQQIYEDILKGKVNSNNIEDYVENLIIQANTFLRKMDVSNPEDFLYIRGHRAHNGKYSLDAGNPPVVLTEGDWMRYGNNTMIYHPKLNQEGRLGLKGDVSTWWDQRRPDIEGVSVSNGMWQNMSRVFNDGPLDDFKDSMQDKIGVPKNYGNYNGHIVFITNTPGLSIADKFTVRPFTNEDLLRPLTLGYKNGGKLNKAKKVSK